MAVLACALPALYLALLALFLSLDLVDIYFKTVWLGPIDVFGFEALGTTTFATTPLVPTANISELATGDEVDFVSGWPSLLSTCDALYGSSGDLVVAARATNCRVGVMGREFKADDLFLVAGARVDAVAWTACKLLYLHRRPPLCQENVVTEFFYRYRLSDPIVSFDAMAEPNSDAETELLTMLDLLSRSYPLNNVICVEAIQYGGTGVYPMAPIVACASPNVFDAAFVGFHAPAFTALHHDKTYLTVDVLNLLGFEFVIRQNSKSFFRLATNDHGSVTLAHHTTINFSSFGHLYILVIAVDMVLLVAHTRSALETASVLLLPLLGTRQVEDVARLTHEYSWTILYRSLYRSPPIVALTLFSGLLSWQFQLPNAIIWTWDELSSGRLYAVLSSIRLWMIVQCLLNVVWNLVVGISESHAYRVTQRTFLSTFEVLVIGVIVAILELQRTFAILSTKYAAEGQRLWDSESFRNHTTYANRFNEELDYLLCTTAKVLGIVYAPLFRIIGETLLVAFSVLVLRFVYYSFRHRNERLLEQDDEASEVVTTYERLPLEELLRVPVRAQSLIRSTFPVELVAQNERYLPPSIYFDFGVILDNEIIRTRRGFFNVIHLKVDVAKYFSPVGKSHVASVEAVTTVNLRRGTAFEGMDAVSPSFTRPPATTTSPLPRPASSRAILSAVAATDGVGTTTVDDKDADTGRRPLAATVGSLNSRSMRRRKSTTELPSIDDNTL